MAANLLNANNEVTRKLASLAFNINAGKSLANILATNLGPRGTLKMYVTDFRVNYTCSDATPNFCLSASHPTQTSSFFSREVCYPCFRRSWIFLPSSHTISLFKKSRIAFSLLTRENKPIFLRSPTPRRTWLSDCYILAYAGSFPVEVILKWQRTVRSSWKRWCVNDGMRVILVLWIAFLRFSPRRLILCIRTQNLLFQRVSIPFC